MQNIFALFFGYLNGIDAGFTASFLMFYLFVPVYNKIINTFSQRELKYLIFMLLFMYCICGTFFMNIQVFSEVGWYATLYFVAAYMRLYPSWWNTSKKFAGIALTITGVGAILVMLLIDFIGPRFEFYNYEYFTDNSNKLFAFLIGLFAFCFFNNMKERRLKLINIVASTTFGILLIHSSTSGSRIYLWVHLLKVPEMYHRPLHELILHAVLSVIFVFVIGAIIDLIRINCLEKPFFKWINSKEQWIESKIKNLVESKK